MALTGTGNVSLRLIMDGQQNVDRALKQAQKGLDDTGRSARRLGGDAQQGIGKMEGTITNLPGRIADVAAGFNLVGTAVSTVTGLVSGLFNQIREGEKALNIDTLFRSMVDDAESELGRLREASRGIVDDTSLQQETNKLRLLGFETAQIARLVDASMKVQIATGDDWIANLDRMSEAILSGSKEALTKIGVTVDLAAETERAAVATDRATDAFSQQELIAIRLSAVTDALSAKFERLPIDQMALDVQQMDTAFANALSNFQTWLASNDDAEAKTAATGQSIDSARVSIDAYSDALESLAAQMPSHVGAATGDVAASLREMADAIANTDGAVARTLRLNADSIAETMQLTAAQAEELSDTLDRLALRRRERAREQLDQMRQERAELQSLLGAQVDEINDAIDAEDKAAEDAERKREERQRDREAKAKAAAAKARSLRQQIFRAELELESARASDLDRLDQIELKRRQEIQTAERELRESGLEGQLLALRRELANAKAASASADEIRARNLDAERKAAAESAAIEDLRYAQKATMIERGDAIARAAIDRDREIAALRRALAAEEITAAEFEERERLAIMEFAATEREEFARRAREAAEEAQRAAEETIYAYDALVSGLQRSQSVTAKVFATTAKLAATVAANYKALAQGSTAAIMATAETGFAAIESEKVRAGAMAAVATATALLEFARGNPVQGALGLASAAAFAAFAGSSTGGKGSTGGGPGAPLLAGSGAANQAIGPDVSAAFAPGGAGTQTLVIEGWRGQDLTAQVAGDTEAARRNGIDRRRV